MLRTLPPRFKSCLATNQVPTSCVTLTFDWIKLRGSHFIHGIHVTCRKANLPWAGKMRLSTFCNNFSQPATTWFVARQVWFVGGKTGNISFEPVLQQCCKTSSCTYLLSVLPVPLSKNVYYRVLSYDWYGPARNVVGNPYASIDRAGKTRTALLEKRTVWCGFAPSEKHNGHMIKSLLTELDRARRALGPYVLTSSQIVSLTGLPLSQ